MVPESLMAERSKAVASDAVARVGVGSNPSGGHVFFLSFRPVFCVIEEEYLNSVGSLLRGSTASS